MEMFKIVWSNNTSLLNVKSPSNSYGDYKYRIDMGLTVDHNNILSNKYYIPDFNYFLENSDFIFEMCEWRDTSNLGLYFIKNGITLSSMSNNFIWKEYYFKSFEQFYNDYKNNDPIISFLGVNECFEIWTKGKFIRIVKKIKKSKPENMMVDEVKGRLLSYLDSKYQNEVADLIEHSKTLNIQKLLNMSKDRARKQLKYDIKKLTWKQVKDIVDEIWVLYFKTSSKGSEKPLIETININNKKSRKVYDKYLATVTKKKFIFTAYGRQFEGTKTTFTYTIMAINLNNAFNIYRRKNTGKLKLMTVMECDKPDVITGKLVYQTTDHAYKKWAKRMSDPDFTTVIKLKKVKSKEAFEKRKLKRVEKSKNGAINKSISNTAKPDKMVCMYNIESGEVVRIWKSKAEELDQLTWSYTSKSTYKSYINRLNRNNKKDPNELHKNREVTAIPSVEYIETKVDVNAKLRHDLISMCKAQGIDNIDLSDFKHLEPKYSKVAKSKRLCTGLLKDLPDRRMIKGVRKLEKEAIRLIVKQYEYLRKKAINKAKRNNERRKPIVNNIRDKITHYKKSKHKNEVTTTNA